jgi:hypothetical protein
MTKLKFIRTWRGYSKGQSADVPGGLAVELVSKRVAILDDQPTLIETAAIDRHTETADATPRKRGRRAISQPDSPDAPSR